MQRLQRIGKKDGNVLRPNSYYFKLSEDSQSEPIQQQKMSKQYCQALVEDRTIYFELTPAQLYEDNGSDDLVPICWEDEGQVFSGEMSLEDILTLDFQPEKKV